MLFRSVEHNRRDALVADDDDACATSDQYSRFQDREERRTGLVNGDVLERTRERDAEVREGPVGRVRRGAAGGNVAAVAAVRGHAGRGRSVVAGRDASGRGRRAVPLRCRRAGGRGGEVAWSRSGGVRAGGRGSSGSRGGRSLRVCALEEHSRQQLVSRTSGTRRTEGPGVGAVAAGVGALSPHSLSQPVAAGVGASLGAGVGAAYELRPPYAGVRPPARGSGVRPPSLYAGWWCGVRDEAFQASGAALPPGWCGVREDAFQASAPPAFGAGVREPAFHAPEPPLWTIGVRPDASHAPEPDAPGAGVRPPSYWGAGVRPPDQPGAGVRPP